VEAYIIDWLNLGVRWLKVSNKGAMPPCIAPE